MPKFTKTGIRTLYNKYILPPWKPYKLKTKGKCNIEFVIECQTIPSVKNEPQPFVNYSAADKKAKQIIDAKGALSWNDYVSVKKMNKLRITRTDTYKKFIEEWKPEIQRQMQVLSSRLKDKGLIFPISKAIVDCKFYCSTSYREDSINKEETILDLLVKAGVIADDSRFEMPVAKRESVSYKDEIVKNMVKVTLTFNL